MHRPVSHLIHKFLHMSRVDLSVICSFFLPIGTGTSTHSIGKNSVKIKQIDSYRLKFRLPYIVSIVNLRVFRDNFLNSVSIFMLVLSFFNIYCCETSCAAISTFDLVPLILEINISVNLYNVSE